jgi:hypothetical protein
MILLLSPLKLSAQAEASPSSSAKSAEELARRYRSAHAARNVEAVKRLFYWGASTAASRELVSTFITQDVAHDIKTVSVVPLEPTDVTQYTQGGVVYRMTLAPTAKLRIDFVPRRANGGQYNSEQTTYFIGERSGEYWLLTAEPAPVHTPD